MLQVASNVKEIDEQTFNVGKVVYAAGPRKTRVCVLIKRNARAQIERRLLVMTNKRVEPLPPVAYGLITP